MIQKIVRTALAAIPAFAAVPAIAQDRSLDLTVNNVGISIGDSRRVTGLRLNFRDLDMREVKGINATIWSPYEPARGTVRGVALGLPVTGARHIEGLAIGLFGVGADETIRGLSIGGIGMGAGEDIRGIAIGGIGMGVGQDLRGAALGGIGMGVGGDMRGIAIGGIGLGIGGSSRGVLIGGIGAGAGGDVEGLSIAGIGIGAGGNVKGLSVTGVGMGAGGDVTGVQIAGIGIGSGGTLKWVSIAGVGIGAPRIEGFAAAAGIGSENVRGVVFAPIYFKIANDGRMRGVNISAYNDVRGTQQGLAIGLFNFARELDGVQIGVLNYAGNKSRGTRILPIFNYARAR
jgi:hypothetical protein